MEEFDAAYIQGEFYMRLQQRQGAITPDAPMRRKTVLRVV
jgi:hypothetical protein